jgi:hypothetical protein
MRLPKAHSTIYDELAKDHRERRKNAGGSIGQDERRNEAGREDVKIVVGEVVSKLMAGYSKERMLTFMMALNGEVDLSQVYISCAMSL